MYVDDIILTRSNTKEVDHILFQFNTEFAIRDLGALLIFLGIEATNSHLDLFLSQSKYIRDLLLKTHMDGEKPVSTPMATDETLSRFSRSPSLSDSSEYHSTVGTLQYLTITRPDIAFSVNKVSQFM